MAMLEKGSMTLSVKQYYRMKEKFNFEIAEQRKYNIWPLKKKSELIDSLCYGRPIGVVYSNEDSITKLNLIDGKQRFTTVFDYMDGKFALHDETNNSLIWNETNKEWEEVSVAGKYFSELPKELQEEIESYTITVYYYKDLTDEQIETIFYYLQNGTPLTSFEKTRSQIGKLRPVIMDIANNSEYLQKKTGLTDSMLNHFVDQEIVLQIMMLIERRHNSDFSGKSMEAYAYELNKKGISCEMQSQVIDILDYLNEAINEQIKTVSKVHLPILCMVVKEALDCELPAEDFKKWVLKFFVGSNATRLTNEKYANAASKGTSKSESIKTRLDEMIFDFAEWNAEREEDTGFTSEDLRTSSRVVGV